MELSLSGVNWLAVVASVVAAQIISTLWFTVLFGEPWAQEYGAGDKRQHTREIPGYTYGVQLLCTALMVLSVAVLQRSLGVGSLSEALMLGALLGVGFCLATGVPGQAFLKRWRVAGIAFGCQVTMILAVSIILALWR